jgi:tetratricopeptide (TPR) repeat protein
MTTQEAIGDSDSLPAGSSLSVLAPCSAWSNLGNALKDLGRLDDAVQCYSAAISLRCA